jgi:hypothetical protein
MDAPRTPSQPPRKASRESPARRLERLRRQEERVREMERLMRAAATFARGRQIG